MRLSARVSILRSTARPFSDLLPVRFLEGERRSDILEGGQLARFYVFRNRLPMMHRAGWNGPKIETGKVAFAWFIWDREHHGPATLHRISWSADDASADPPAAAEPPPPEAAPDPPPSEAAEP
jgi:hypothetical protein